MAAVPAPAREGGAAVRRRHTLVAWMFALPFMVLFVVFMAGPVLASLGMSFTDLTSRDLRNPLAVNLVGLENYTRLLSDERFLRSAFNTGYFVVVGIPLTMVLALAVAVALNSGIDRFRTLFRVGFYTPVVTSIVAVAVVWRFILQPDSGLLNQVLGWVGIDGPNWLQSTTWAMPSLIAMAAWRNLGTLMVIFLAGLQTIPRDLHEQAMVDGAGAWRRFRSITLPLLRPTLLLGAVLTGRRLPPVLRGAVRDDQGRPPRPHPVDRVLHLQPVRLRQLQLRRRRQLPAVPGHRGADPGAVPAAPVPDLKEGT